jgi:putative ABC transport system permease protein
VTGIDLSGVLELYKARYGLKSAVVREAFAVLGIAIGVALLFASQIASTSLTHSVTQLHTQFVGSAQVQLEARGPEGVSERLLGEARRQPGVQVALPVFDKQVNVVGRTGERSVYLIGVNPQEVRASGPLLRRFSAHQLAAQQAIALPTPLANEIGIGPLQIAKVQIGARFIETLVGTTLGEADIGQLVHSPVAVAPLGYAQRLAGTPGQINLIFVRYKPGRAREAHVALERLAAKWNVNLEPGTFDSQLFSVAVAPESQSETLFSGISALVGFMFALNAMLITVPSRRALIEEIRPQGASRWDTAKILLFDALVIGTVACVLGLVLGNFLSVAVFKSTPSYLAVAFPVGNNRVVTWQCFALAIGAGMAAAVIGVFWPLREILARALQPLPDPTNHRRAWTAARLVLGSICLALTTAILLFDTKAALVGNIALVAALVVLMPLLFDALVRLFEFLSKVLDGVGSALAVTELQTAQTRVRSLAIAATVAVAVFGVVEFQGIQTNLERGLNKASRDVDAAAAVWVLPGGRLNVQPTTPFSAATISTAALARVPGVGQISVFRGSFLDWGNRRLWVLAPASSISHPIPTTQVVSGDPTLAAERVRQGGWAVLSQALADEHGLHVGQTFTLPAPRPLQLRVAALTTNLGWAPGTLILNAATYARAWQSNAPTAYAIQTTGGATAAVVRDRIRHATASARGLVVETAAERDKRRFAIAKQGLSRLTQIRLLVLIAAILAVIGSMGAMIWQRRDLIAFIKVQGYEEGTLRRWLLCEAGILLTVGCLIGAVFGLYAQLLGSRFLATVTGYPIVFNVEVLAAITSFVLVSVVAFVAVALPGYLVVRVPANTESPAY